MPEVHLERERKYDVDAGTEVPPMTALLDGAAGQLPPAVDGGTEEHHLAATYLDTPDLRLAAAGLTLRRRTGGHDAGWHLKVPAAGGARTEVREPLGDGTDEQVPEPLLRMVRAVTRGEGLVPVARISTVRTEHRLVGTTGRVLAELADDRVDVERLSTTDAPAAAVPGWREVEVELVDGDETLLAALDAGLRRLGLREAAVASKLSRVLGGRTDDEAGPPEPGKRSTAGEVVLAHVAAQVAQVRDHDLPVRLDAPDSVHRMRVACRRLRSALSTFGAVLDAGAVRPLREELRWLAGELGTARDAEVLRDRLLRALAQAQDSETDEPSTTTHPEVAADAAQQLDGTYRAAHERVLRALDDERYHRLLLDLDALVADPPWTELAGDPARDVLPRLVRRRYRQLRRLVRDARREPPGEAREVLLHEARKAAKKTRYAAEAVAPVFAGPARRFASAVEDVQEVLGEHQDSVVTRARLLELARSTASPAAAFAYGRLHAQEEQHGALAGRRSDDVWDRASRGRLRRWLR